MTSLIVNIFGAPGAGKSTTATPILDDLIRRGIKPGALITGSRR